MTVVLIFLSNTIDSIAAQQPSSYIEHQEALRYMKELSQSLDVSEKLLLDILASVQVPVATTENKILKSESRPAEKTKTWANYQDQFINPKRIRDGVKFWATHKAILEQASNRFGVPIPIIVATIGIESSYGNYRGKHKIVDALVTLSFSNNKREKFYRNQLKDFIVLVTDNNWDLPTILAIKGSYSGAIGPAQFIPSSIHSFSIDGNNDRIIDMIHSWDDIIFSVANYYHKAHMKPFDPIMFKLDTPPKDITDTIIKVEGKHGVEYWQTYPNYRSILRYNNSHLYALAVYHLSEDIRIAYLRETAVSKESSEKASEKN